MNVEFQADTSQKLNAWANSAGGRGGPRGFNSQPIDVPDLQAIRDSWHAPVEPPQRIDFTAIAADASNWANTTFGHLSTPEFKQEVSSYWGVQPAAPAAPAFMQGPNAAEPSVYYGSPAPEQGITMPSSLAAANPAPFQQGSPGVSMGALERAERYALQTPGGAFNSKSVSPLSHMAGFTQQTQAPATNGPKKGSRLDNA